MWYSPCKLLVLFIVFDVRISPRSQHASMMESKDCQQPNCLTHVPQVLSPKQYPTWIRSKQFYSILCCCCLVGIAMYSRCTLFLDATPNRWSLMFDSTLMHLLFWKMSCPFSSLPRYLPPAGYLGHAPPCDYCQCPHDWQSINSYLFSKYRACLGLPFLLDACITLQLPSAKKNQTEPSVELSRTHFLAFMYGSDPVE